MKKKLIAGLLAALCLTLGACSAIEASQTPAEVSTPAATQADGVTMQMLPREDFKQALLGGQPQYIALDVRSAPDYAAQHIRSAFSASVTIGAEADDPAGQAALRAALAAATGSETGREGDLYAVLCYKGAAYAQKATELLVGLGVPAEAIFTLEGGYQGWLEGDESYQALLE